MRNFAVHTARPLLFFLVLASWLVLPGIEAARTQQTPFHTQAKHAILLDSLTGKVLFEKAADEPMPPASMSKIMTMIMVFEGLKENRLRLSDGFVVSEDAWRRGGGASGGSTMYAEPNSRIKLEDLIRGVIVQSANDASIAIAESLAGSEAVFAQRMTERARELGLQRSTFKNATGLPHPEHVMTARELAYLTRYLIHNFPEYYRIYSEREFTWNDITQSNRNPLLGKYPGADGVKTGYTSAAGYGLVSSAKRHGRRLIGVVTGLNSRRARSVETEKLLDWGFRQFRLQSVFRSGDRVGNVRVWGGEQSTVPAIADEDLQVMLADEERIRAEAQLVYNGPVRAPVRRGDEVGKVRILLGGQVMTEQPVFAERTVPASEEMWRKAWSSLAFMIFGG